MIHRPINAFDQERKSGEVQEHHIMWTRTMLAQFKSTYTTAVNHGKTEFTFQGNTFVTSYAKYLIEYLKGRFA